MALSGNDKLAVIHWVRNHAHDGTGSPQLDSGDDGLGLVCKETADGSSTDGVRGSNR